MDRIIIGILLASGLIAQNLPQGTTNLFAGSGNCAVCHAPGGPNPSALLDSDGNDISPTTLWRSSMMAHSAKDPLWQAKVQAEILVHPHLQELIEDKCSTCHAPMGRTEAIYDGADGYSIDSMLDDPLALDGVSCAACHQIHDPLVSDESTFSGHYVIDDSRQIFGPHQSPVTSPMQNMLNYTPVYSDHMEDSEICATCHTLFTPYLDDAGEIAGEAPEQVPYLEWLNSDYPDLDIQCQTCHMPAYDSPVAIANRPPWLGDRDPLHKHEFTGGNVFMLRLLKEFRDELGITATESQMESSIQANLSMLQNSTAELNIESHWQADSLMINVGILNLTGHKFPTAYPSRRAWIELEVSDEVGNHVFHSGSWNTNGEISGLDSIYEPHHSTIRQEDQVQIYENVPMDINGEATFTLLRIAGYLKDNRIPPRGYTSDGPAADSTRIEGLAIVDQDFNRSDDLEGTGSDQVIYVLGGLDPSQSYSIRASLNFQSVSPPFVDDLFQYDLPEVNQFQTYYEAMDLTPITLAEYETSSEVTQLYEKNNQVLPVKLGLGAYPNPFNPDTNLKMDIPFDARVSLSVFDLNGSLLEVIELGSHSAGHHLFQWRPAKVTSQSSGIYLLRLEIEGENSSRRMSGYQKVVLLK